MNLNPFKRRDAEKADVGPQNIKQNPVAVADMGYAREEYAPFCQQLLIQELGDHPLAFLAVRKIGMEAAQARMLVDDPVLQELLDRPNPEHTGASFRQLVYMMLAGIGDCVVAKQEDAAKTKIEELWVIRIDRMKIVRNAKGQIVKWTYRNGGKPKDFRPDEIMRLKHSWIDLDEFGRANAYPMRSSLKYYDGYNDWNNQLLDGAQGVSEILALDGGDPVDENRGKQIMDLLRKFKLSKQNGMVGGRVFLNAPVKSVSKGVSPADLQVTEWFDRLTKSILNGYGVPPILLNIGESITFENQREARASFWEDTLLPLYVKPLAEALSQFLGVDVRPELDNVPALAQRRCDMMNKLSTVDFMTTNEKRKAVGLTDIDGGDSLLVDAGKLPIDFGLESVDAVTRQVEDLARDRGIKI